MKIGIDGGPLLSPNHCGVRHYAENLLHALASIDRKNTYIIYTSQKVHIPKQLNFQLRIIPIKFPLLKRQVQFPLEVYRDNVDVFHYLDPYGSIWFRHPRIITTVHDTQLNRIFPPSFSYDTIFDRVYCEITRIGTFKQTNTFISVSKTIYSEVERFRVQQQRNIIVYEGARNVFKAIKSFKKRKILAFQDFSPRKNLTTVIDSYILLPITVRLKYKLTIIVPDKSIQISTTSLLKSKLDELFFEVKTNVSERDLVNLYNESICLVYPSLYEGFGLPIIEAMACGCPVITTNYGAMKEITDEAAILVDPLSSQEIAHAIASLINDPTIKDFLVKKGKIRSSHFTWIHTARETLKVYCETF